MSYGRFFACGNKLLSPTMEPDLTIVMTLVKTRFLKKKIICHGIEWLGLANFSGKFLGNLFDDNEHHTNFCRFYPLNPSFRSGQSDRMKKNPHLNTNCKYIGSFLLLILFLTWWILLHDNTFVDVASKTYVVTDHLNDLRYKNGSTLTQSYHFLWYFNLGRNHGRRESRWKV